MVEFVTDGSARARTALVRSSLRLAMDARFAALREGEFPMTQDTKLVLAGLALMAAGTAAGWNATQRSLTASTTPSSIVRPSSPAQPRPAVADPADLPAPAHMALATERGPRRLHVGPFPRGEILPAGTPISIRLRTSLDSKT